MRRWNPGQGKSGREPSDTMGDGTPCRQQEKDRRLSGDRVHPQPSSRHQQREPKPPPRKRPRREAAARWPSGTTSSTQEAHADAMRDGGQERPQAGESCDVDVDMGTPTAAAAATNSHSDWREAARGASRVADLGDGHGAWRAHDTLDRDEGDGSASQTDATARARQAIVGASSHSNERRRRHAEGESPGDDGVVEIQAFREYSHDDIDSLDILPSQDFVGELRDESPAVQHTSTTRSSQPDSSAWRDFRDCTQFRDEEASEVFDNVIYAPPTLPPRAESVNPPTAMPSPNPPPPHHSSVLDDQYESESELSDGYEVPCAVFSSDRLPRATSTPSPPPPPLAAAPPATNSSRASSASGTPPQVPPLHWCARMSVKRDCSFIDQTLKHRRKQLSVQDLSESGEEFEEKLKLIDGDDDGDSEDNCSSTSTAKSLMSSSSSYSASVPRGNSGLMLPGFRPKKKRRKVRQLALDAFLKVQPSATY